MLAKLTKFIESDTYRHRLQRDIVLPFPPFPGLILSGYTDGPVELIVEKVCLQHPGTDKLGTPILHCILKPASIDSEEVWPRVEPCYGKDWQIDGCPTGGWRQFT